MSTDKALNSKKMRWLNRISSDCAVNATAFRVAYIIADHLNSATETAWPSQTRIAKRLCMSPQSVQRAIKDLETFGWLSVGRTRDKKTSNRYALAWPGLDATIRSQGVHNKNVSLSRQQCRQRHDAPVSLSYSENLPTTYSTAADEDAVNRRFADRGTYEERIVSRFGPDIRELFDRLAEAYPDTLDALCRAEKEGQLTLRAIEAAEAALRYAGRKIMGK